MYEIYGDNQLIGLIRESSEEAKDLIFDKYKHIIDIEVNKFINVANLTGYDYSDLYQQAIIGFNQALNDYREDKDMTLPSFISLCIRRKLQANIIKAGRKKNLLISEAISLDYQYKNSKVPLKELISDNYQNDPLQNIVKNEYYQDLLKEIKNILSSNEYDVYNLLLNGINYNEIALIMNKTPKQIDNCIQRIKSKLKLIKNKTN